MNNLGDYHDLYVRNDTLLLADVFEIFRNKCIEIYELFINNLERHCLITIKNIKHTQSFEEALYIMV